MRGREREREASPPVDPVASWWNSMGEGARSQDTPPHPLPTRLATAYRYSGQGYLINPPVAEPSCYSKDSEASPSPVAVWSQEGGGIVYSSSHALSLSHTSLPYTVRKKERKRSTELLLVEASDRGKERERESAHKLCKTFL